MPFLLVLAVVASSVTVALSYDAYDANIRIDLLLAPVAGVGALITLILAAGMRLLFREPPHVAAALSCLTLILAVVLWSGDLRVERATARILDAVGWQQRECGDREPHVEWGRYCDQDG